MRCIATFWCMHTMTDNTNRLKFYNFSPITVNELTFTGHIIIFIRHIINYWPRLFLFHAWLTQPLNTSTFGFVLLILVDPKGHKRRLCPFKNFFCVVLGENGQITDLWPHHWVGTPVWESLDPPLTYPQLSILHHMYVLFPDWLQVTCLPTASITRRWLVMTPPTGWSQTSRLITNVAVCRFYVCEIIQRNLDCFTVVITLRQLLHCWHTLAFTQIVRRLSLWTMPQYKKIPI